MRCPVGLLVVTTTVAAFSVAGCRSARISEPPAAPSASSSSRQVLSPANGPCLNINTASAAELSMLPGIGEVLAARIVDYREQHGAFRRPQEIIIIEGMSERRYRKFAARICVG